MASEPKPPGEPVIGYPAADAAAPPPPSAAAYPYVAPPQAHAHAHAHASPYFAVPPANPYYAVSRANHSLAGRFAGHALLRRIIIAVFVAFLLIGTISFFLWLILRPRLPVFSVSAASVSGFNLSSSSAADPKLSSSFDLTLSVANPNEKMDISYNQVAAEVAYGDYILAKTTLPPFYQEKQASTTLRAKPASWQEYVSGDVARGISGDRANGGAVGFEVMVEASVWFRTKAWRTRGSVMRVYCSDIRIAFADEATAVGSMVGPPKQCQVNL